MARTKQKLINYHTNSKTAMPSGSSVDYGEIVVRHNAESPELLIKVGVDSFGVFQASGAVKTAIDSAVSTAKSELNKNISDLETSLSGHVADFEQFQTDVQTTYATKEELKSASGSIITAYEKAVGDAKIEIYNSATTFATNAVTTAKGELNGTISTVKSNLEALSGVVKSISTNIGDNYVDNDTLNTKVTELEGKISAAQKAATDASSAYTDTKFEEAKTYTDNQISTSEAATKGLIDNVISDLGDLKTTVETDYVLKTTLDTKVSDLTSSIATAKAEAIGDASAYTDTQFAAAKEHSDGKLSAATESLKQTIKTVDEKVDTLSGNVHTRIESLETDLTNTINNKVAVAYRYQKTVTNYADLPTSEMSKDTIGYVYNVENANGNYPAGTNYAWNGTEWDALGGSVDLSPYATTEDVNKKIETINQTNINLKSDIDNLSAGTEALVSAVSAATVATYATKAELKATSGSIITAYTNAIDAAKKEAIGTASGYTDAQVLAAKNTLSQNIEAVDGRVTSLSSSTVSIKATADSAIQNVNVISGCGATIKKSGTLIDFDFSTLVIDCGDF